jgi:hypothetical protein
MIRQSSARGTRLRGTCVVVAAVLCVMLLPGTARAGDNTIFNGYMDYAGAYGPQHTLTSVWTTWYNYNYSCINAWDVSSSSWAGVTVCANESDVNVGHGYCQCALRKGYGRAWSDIFVTYAFTRQFW